MKRPAITSVIGKALGPGHTTAEVTATVDVGVFSDLRERRSERQQPRTRNLERGGILTLKGSNRCLGQEFSGIMMTRKKKRGHSDHSAKHIRL